MMMYNYRYTATICIEATTTLSVGLGREGLTTDRLIARDANGLPYIPGTALAGLLRHALQAALPNENWDTLFGFAKGDKGTGSRLIFSSAHLISSDGKKVLDGLQNIPDPAYYTYKVLPERDHVRINHRGAAEKHGKFEEELVYRGSRFVFSIELTGSKDDEANWKSILTEFSKPTFRLGGGTRKGFGALKIIAIEEKCYQFDNNNSDDIIAYLKNDSRLRLPNAPVTNAEHTLDFIHYRLELKPNDFFFFGAGLGDGDVDEVVKTEKYFLWENDVPKITDAKILIPATSVKGALSHRTAFYYNKLTNTYADATSPKQNDQPTIVEVPVHLQELNALEHIPDGTASIDDFWEKRIAEIEAIQFPEIKGEKISVVSAGDKALQYVGENNEAVRQLFGYAGDDKDGQRGQVLFSDVYLESGMTPDNTKIFDHVSIDRYTGGAKDGALFQEKTVTTKAQVAIDFYVAKAALADDHVRCAWEAALQDVAIGQLALGGKTTKGHGLFTGKLYKNNEPVNTTEK